MAWIRYTDECLRAARGEWPASGAWLAEPGSRTGHRRARPKKIRMFENGFIEHVLARAHPVTPILWFGPLIAYGLVVGVRARGLGATLGLFAGGWLIWTLLEYLLHRFLFHLGARTEAERLRAFMIHGYHHEFPNDKTRLVAPPPMSWPLAVLVLGTYWLVLGKVHGLALFAGTATGYVAYDWIHYFAHHFRPRGRVGQWLKSYHLLHHFEAGDAPRRFGVSTPLWDFVFGTYAPAKKGAGAVGPAARA